MREVVIVEIRAAEGGADAKLLVRDQVEIYGRLAKQRCL
jgi:protein subunit release factor A